jgi:hypothetical protein
LGESRIGDLIDTLIQAGELSLVNNDSRGWPALQRVSELWGSGDMGIPLREGPEPQREIEYRAALAADRREAQARRDALTDQFTVSSANGHDEDVVEILRAQAMGPEDEDLHVDAWYERWGPGIDHEFDPYLNAVLDRERRVCWEPIDAWLRYAAVTRAVVNEAEALSRVCKQLPTVEESRERFIEFVCQSWRPLLSPHDDDSLADPKTWAIPDGCKWEAAREWDSVATSRQDFGPKEALSVRRTRFAQTRDALVNETGLALHTAWTDDGKLSDVLGPRLGTVSAWGIVVEELHQLVKRPSMPACSICRRRYLKFEGTRVNRKLCCPHCQRVSKRKYQRGDFLTE